ncbi:MAG: hypothetical protein HOP08_18835 [Cyclobacteriaceae bacterium]|nr:hypothetical protein [Cyclobacteriaceae bacterium]
MTELKQKAEDLSGRIGSAVKTKVGMFSNRFNALESGTKKWSLALLGISMACMCTAIIINGLQSGKPEYLRTESISLPKDIYMDTIKAERLTPVGKMKGEVYGEFESFYLATNKEGKLFINRNIEYSENAYDKSNGWEQITRQQLEVFEKHLDLIPPRKKGMKR